MSAPVPAQAPTPTPAAGYKPGVAMPIIPPPPQGTDPVGYYDHITSTTTITVEAVSPTRLHMTVSNITYSDLYAVTGGSVNFIPAGSALPLPGNPPSPGAGSLVLQTWADDVREMKKILPPGVPPELYTLYLNVTDTSVRAALDPFVRALPGTVLQGAWNQPTPPTSYDDLLKNYLDRVLLGQVQVFVPPGTKIGVAGPAASSATDHEVTLVFKDRAGNELSPVLHLRGMPSYADPKWTHHPVAEALESIPVPVSIHLQFEVWNKATKTFEKLPANVPVDVVDYDPLSPNDVLATQMTDASGRVQFNFPNLEETAGELPDLFFVARTNGISHAGHTLPAEWSTKGWKSADGNPGYYEDFAGTQLGDASNPLVFRVGLDFHIKLQYRNDLSHLIDPAPKGVPIGLKTLPGPPPKILGRTDDKGEIHDVVFDISGEDDVFFEVNFEIEDSSIHLPRARALIGQVGWSTFWEDADRTPSSYYPKNDQTSIGSQTVPASLLCTVNERNLALFFLKIVREWNTFFFHITGGAWTGVTGLEIWRNVLPPATRSFSWPVGVVQIHPDDHWNRGTIVHELSHQVVWKQANYSTLGIAVEARLKGDWPFFGQLALYHWTDLFLNSEQALIEGWPEFIEAIFEHQTTSIFPYPPKTPGSATVGESGTPNGVLGPPPNNRGESVEGAFANGLWRVFVDHVVTSAWSDPYVPESPNGDITATTDPWLTDPAVRDRFMNIIWHPLTVLADLDNPTTTNYITAMESNNTVTGVWPALKATLQTCNMAF